MNSLKREIITLFSLKSMWIVPAVVIIACGLFMYQNYNNVQTNVNLLLEDYDSTQIEKYDSEYIQQLKMEIIEIYATFDYKNFLYNSYGILIGIGMLVFPIVGIIYIADDYNKRVIKNKIVYDGLTKVVFSKIVSMFGYLTFFLIIYYFLQLFETRFLYNNYLRNIDLKGLVSKNDVNFETKSGIYAIVTTFIILYFYTLLCMLLTFISKNMVIGFVMLIVNNYVVLPMKYTPHNIFNWLINKVFVITEYSPFNFTSKMSYQNTYIPIVILAICFFVIMLIFYFASKVQKN